MQNQNPIQNPIQTPKAKIGTKASPKPLTFKQATVLAFLRQWPYMTASHICGVFFKKKGYTKSATGKLIFKKGSAAAKLVYGLKQMGFLQTLWPRPSLQAYAITKKGQKAIESYVALYGAPTGGGETIPWWWDDQGSYRVLEPDKILYRFPFNHVQDCLAYFVKSEIKNRLILSDMCSDVLNDFNIKSRPDFLIRGVHTSGDLVGKYNGRIRRGCIEIENSAASKTRKYAKIRSLYRDDWQWVLMVFKTEKEMKAYMTEDWRGFCEAFVYQKGGTKKYILEYNEYSWAYVHMIFTVLGSPTAYVPWTYEHEKIEDIINMTMKKPFPEKVIV